MTALPALELYGRNLAADAPETTVRSRDGGAWPLPVARYLAPATATDEDVLARVAAPVLDVGCGPGRHVLALSQRRTVALGLDVSPAAVRIARARGALVLERSVFGAVPGAGSWGTALLLDGNIGIGGRPTVLLRRLRSLLRPGGRVLVELDGEAATDERPLVRLEVGQIVSDWFRWARVGTDELGSHAAAAGLRVAETWEREARRFACLVSP